MKQPNNVSIEEHRLKAAAQVCAIRANEFSIKMLAEMLEDENPLARKAAMEVLAEPHNDALTEKVMQAHLALLARQEELTEVKSPHTQGKYAEMCC